jgi:hypothetical protein
MTLILLSILTALALTSFGWTNRLEAEELNSASSAGTAFSRFFHLDPRSAYGQEAFPEPFLVDDSDLEQGEFRFDIFHTQGKGQQSDSVKAEVEKGFGLLTVEIEGPYERDVVAGQVSRGAGNIDLGVRYPIYQSVSANGRFDSTFGVALEIGVPTNSAVSKNAEAVPKVFNDFKVGEHFTVQSIAGYSVLYGGGDDGGSRTLEYGFVFGWTFQRDELSWPGVQQFIPVLELSGETALNKDDSGKSPILGNLGFRLNLKTIGSIQPRLGLGYIFPVNRDTRDNVRWGFVTSLVFEF